MAEARRRDEWDRTSVVLALIFNVNRDPKKVRAASPEDFHPLARGRPKPTGIPITRKTIKCLKVLLR